MTNTNPSTVPDEVAVQQMMDELHDQLSDEHDGLQRQVRFDESKLARLASEIRREKRRMVSIEAWLHAHPRSTPRRAPDQNDLTADEAAAAGQSFLASASRRDRNEADQ